MPGEDEKPPALRRSSRSTRGSIKPIVDLTKPDLSDDEKEAAVSKPEKVDSDDDDVQVLDDDDDEDFEAPKTKVKTKRNSTSKKQATSAKKQPQSKQPTTKSATKASAVKATKNTTVKASKSTSLSEEKDVEAEKSHDDVADVFEVDYILNEAEMKEVNDAFDKNCSSDNEELLDAAHLKTAIRAIGFEPRADEIKKLMKKFSNSVGKVNRDGFHKIMALKMGAAPGTNDKVVTDEISKVFNLLDLDKTGMITLENLRSVSKELNEEIDDEELLEMITEADLDGDLMINKEEFYNIMKKTSLY